MKTSTNLAGIIQAHERIKPFIRRTPLEYSYELSRQLKAKVWLKLENLQVTGSFKPRGSLNKFLKCRPKSGVIASTAGNHGIGVAYAAQRLGLHAEIYLPTWADEHKIAKLEQFGANLKFFETVEAAREAAQTTAKERDLTFISAYNDSEMICGGGTVGIEIYDDLADVDSVVVGVGGGGFASGICLALKALNPKIQIFGVQAEKNALMTHWLEQRKIVDAKSEATIAEGLAVRMEHETMTFPLLKQYLDRMITVSEAEIRNAMRYGLREHQLIFEPSGAATVAALQKMKAAEHLNIVGIITGQNISFSRLTDILELNDKDSSIKK